MASRLPFPGLFNLMEPGEGGLPSGGPQNTIQLQHDLSWTKGNHAMRFGGQFSYIQMNIAYGAYAQAYEVLGTGVQTGLSQMLSGNLQYYEAAVNPQGKLPVHVEPRRQFECDRSLPRNPARRPARLRAQLPLQGLGRLRPR